ncbi:MAG TPA: cobaltochelatase subunit CobN, partial [Blastocatellia bacterium]|nr:cobaltochelatase subunit CobN [Blastocatellia bacterium]
MKTVVFYVGTSLLAPLRRAEAEINKKQKLDLRIAMHNCGGPLNEQEWRTAERDVEEAELVFIIHVTDSENATRINALLERYNDRHNAVIAFNCMPELMRATRMGKLDFSKLMKPRASRNDERGGEASSRNLAKKLGSWMADFIKGRNGEQGKRSDQTGPRNKSQYVKMIGRLPAILKFIPTAGKLGDVKNYILLFCYFLQPTNNNIRSMLLLAIRQYVPGSLSSIKVDPPETMPAVAIYHPDAPKLFETFEAYKKWYERAHKQKLDSRETIGLLLMRPQIISDARRHYDALIRAIENEGLACIPAISTFMDNRDACRRFLVDEEINGNGKPRSRVSQIVSLTGFSFVGGPAMNDSHAAAEFFGDLDVPFRSVVSLDVQTIENWSQSKLGLNPVQTAMQVAIPELDGAIEAFVFGGLTQTSDQPEPIEDRCLKIARRLARWNRLRVAPRESLRLAFLVFCFPPNKGNIGTAADLDVFPSLWNMLAKLKSEGYEIELPDSADHLRQLLLEGNSDELGMQS